jgi:predicted transposase YbfD/YdcC
MVADIDWLEEGGRWKKLAIIGIAQTETHKGEDITVDNRYFITSMSYNADQFANPVRSHCGIENSCH